MNQHENEWIQTMRFVITDHSIFLVFIFFLGPSDYTVLFLFAPFLQQRIWWDGSGMDDFKVRSHSLAVLKLC